jgi:cytochrome c nitrite reductase small subunit
MALQDYTADPATPVWVQWLLLEPLGQLWQPAVFAVLGLAAGLGLVLFRVSRAHSYLSNAPETCINCHVMNDAYMSWQHGSHARTAVCVDCHVPHSNPVAAYAFKARDGLYHSYVFTTRTEPQVLHLSRGAVPVIQSNCQRCHGSLLSMVRMTESSERTCWDCHDGIHGSTRSLSASPPTMRPKLPPAGLPLPKRSPKPEGIRQ